MVVEKIFSYAQRAPDRIAIYYHGHRISYGEFASCIAHARDLLIRQNLPASSIAVLLDLPSRLEAWSFALALRSLGMTTIAVRNLETLSQLKLPNIGCIITPIQDAALGAIQPHTPFKVIRIPLNFYLNNRPGTGPDFAGAGTQVGGHILLTSGTTGFSKKVLLGEAGLQSVIRRRLDLCGISSNSIVHIFGYALWTGMGHYLPQCAWTVGGGIVFHQDPDAHRSLVAEGVTHAFLTPMDLSRLVAAPRDELRRSHAMILYVTGGPLPRSFASAAMELLTPHLFTYIASTEVGPWTLTRIEGPDDLRSHAIEPSVDVEVVNDEHVPLPPGQTGVVRIRATAGITRYLGDAETSRMFFRDGYFYPGDVGTFRSDGRLVLHGRANNVINVLGEKLPVDRVEQALQDRLSVDGVCLLLRSEDGDDILHILIQSPRAIGEDELTAAIYSEIAAGFPVRVHRVSELPRNDLGKIDRAALKAWTPPSLVQA